MSNNMWNLNAAGTFPARQCLVSRVAANETQYGWSWSWPSDGRTIYAYPEFIRGWKPWDGGASNAAELPARISDLQQFTWRYSLDVVTTGKHNIATSMWVIRSGLTQALPNPSDIAAEIMIWTGGEDFPPGGNYVTTIEVDNHLYDVWYAREWGDVSGSSAQQWSYIAFRGRGVRPAANLDIKAFLDFAVSRGWLDSQHYVADIELGNEIMSGAGYTWINSIDLTLR